MHELGLIYQVIKTVDEVKKEQGLTEICEITLSVGEMTDVVPRFLEEAWKNARQVLGYESTKLTVEIVEGRAKCNDCGNIELVKSFDFECPHCKSTNLSIISGREFEIKNIVAK